MGDHHETAREVPANNVTPIGIDVGTAAGKGISSRNQPDRIASLDFIRGIAVLGILASNIVVFARPNEARRILALVHDVTWTEWMPWLVNYIFIDGKFRGIFAALFGAGLVVFMERARARGAPARWLQFRRLSWLALFGLLHFVLLYEGDILLQYALLAMVAMWMVFWRPRWLLATGILVIAIDSVLASMSMWPGVMEERAVLAMPAEDAGRMEYESYWQAQREQIAQASNVIAQGDLGQILSHRFIYGGSIRIADLLDPVFSLPYIVLQYLPMMLIGAGLYRLGFFSGSWNRLRMMQWGGAGIAFGAIVALAMGLWLKGRQWPFELNYFVFYGPVGILRLPMTLGYMAVLVALAPAIVPRPAGQALSAAGQMAMTNYISMSLVMGFIFQGWGLGLFDRFNRFEQWGFMLLGFALMLGWSRPWLAHFRFGPLEWVWRCLTYWQVFPLRRRPVTLQVQDEARRPPEPEGMP